MGLLGKEELIDKMEEYFDIYVYVYTYYVNIYECNIYICITIFQYACIYIHFKNIGGNLLIICIF